MQRLEDELYDLTREFLTETPSVELKLVGESARDESTPSQYREAAQLLYRAAELIEEVNDWADDAIALRHFAARLIKNRVR